jgi:hypothetical protein
MRNDEEYTEVLREKFGIEGAPNKEGQPARNLQAS